jgi:predicted nucleic acid-binding protein
MLDFSVKAQLGLLQWIHRGGVTMYDIKANGIRRMIELTKKYDDLPMDLADATLVVAAEETGIREIVSIDSNFAVYRTIEKESITNVFGA